MPLNFLFPMYFHNFAKTFIRELKSYESFGKIICRKVAEGEGCEDYRFIVTIVRLCHILHFVTSLSWRFVVLFWKSSVKLTPLPG